MLQASDAIFWLSLTLFTLLGVAYTVMLSLLGQRGTVEAQQRLVERQYLRDLADIQKEIEQEKAFSANQLLSTVKGLMVLDARRRKDLKT